MIFFVVSNKKGMTLIEFIKEYPDEESCKAKFKQYREHVGIVCPKCGYREHYWKRDKECYECKRCMHRQSLRANTVMHKSKLPYRYWFIAMHLLTSAGENFSTKELQRQLGHHRYHPVWHMMHKLRDVMDKCDDEYILAGRIELDERYILTKTSMAEKGKLLKRNKGSRRNNKVIVMAESEFVESPKEDGKPRRIGYLKTKVIDNLKKEAINEQIKMLVNEATEINTNHSTSYVDLKNFVLGAQVIPHEKAGEILPWVHIAISNAKKQIINTFHDIKPEFSQKYIDEFCYIFKRRHLDEALFNRLLVACVSYKNEFRYLYG